MKWGKYVIAECPGYENQALQSVSYYGLRRLTAEHSNDPEQLASEAEADRRLGCCRKALAKLNLAIDTSKNNGLALRPQLFWSKANLLRQTGDYVGAYDALRSAKEGYRLSFNVGGVLDVGAAYAETLRVVGDYVKAWPLHIHLESEFYERHNPRGVIWAMQGRGQMLLMNSSYYESQKLFHRSLYISEEVGDLKSAAFSFRGIGNCFIGLKNPELSVPFLVNALSIFEEIGYVIGQGYVWRSLAWAEFELGNTTRANDAVNIAYSLFRKANHPRGITWLNAMRGRYYFPHPGHTQLRLSPPHTSLI